MITVVVGLGYFAPVLLPPPTTATTTTATATTTTNGLETVARPGVRWHHY